MKKCIIFLLAVVFGIQLSHSQEIITGRILSQSDSTKISGVIVSIPTQNLITTTNENGVFEFMAKSGHYHVLLSRIGYANKELDINLSAILTPIFLTATTSLIDEVTVFNTGYQKVDRERSTGSYFSIDNKLFNEQTGTNVLSRLEGIANGLIDNRVTAGTGGLMIRGLSTIRGNKNVLIILDNFPYEGDLENINPNEVENITILKDAVASSIWGTRAGNGVIVITTKKGRYKRPLQIGLNVNYGVQKKPNLFKVDQISSSDFIDTEILLFGKGYYNSQIASSSKPALSPVVELLIRKRDGTLAAVTADAQINALRSIDVRDQFTNYLYQKSLNQQYALNMTAGTDRYNWRVDAGYDHNLSNLDAGYSRLTSKFQNTIRFLKNFEVTTSIGIVGVQTNAGKPAYNSITSKSGNLYPYAQFRDEAGNSLPIVKDYRYDYILTAGNGNLLDWRYYPLEDYKYNDNTGRNNEILFNGQLNYDISKEFSINLLYQFQQQKGRDRLLYDEQSYYARDLINRFTQIVSGNVVNRVPNGGILQTNENSQTSNNARGQLNFNKIINRHEISAFIGSEWRENSIASNSARYYGYDDHILYSAAADLVNSYPTFITGASAFIPDGAAFKGLNNRYVSFYGNAGYVFDRKYSLTASGRKDASNLFGVNTNDKSNILWSAGAGWLISGENFYHTGILPFLKIRASYGQSGNADPTRTAIVTFANSLSGSPYTLLPYSSVSNAYNPDLKWEVVKTLNIGIDFHFKNNRISGSLDLFKKTTKDLISASDIDFTSGVGYNVIKNIGSTAGKGFDLDLRTVNIDGKFKWLTTVNFSAYRDKITNYYLGSSNGSRYVTSASSTASNLIGYPTYGVFSYKWAGLDPLTGDPQGYLDGVVSKNYSALRGSTVTYKDLVYSGPVLPPFYGSIGNTFTWKNWSATARITYKFGHYFRKQSINYSSLFSNWTGTRDIAERWQKPGDEKFTNVPSLVYPAVSSRDSFYNGSEILVEKADHIRLQYVTLNYLLNKTAIKRLPVQSVNLFVNINNLGILWKAAKGDIDPEYRNSIIPGTSYAFGLRTNF